MSCSTSDSVGPASISGSAWTHMMGQGPLGQASRSSSVEDSNTQNSKG